MLFLGICLMGCIAFSRLKVELFPFIEFPTLLIVTPYENAAPVEVEQLVTRHIEEAVSGVNGVQQVYSESIEGMSIVTARFEWETPMDFTLVEAREKIDSIRGHLPQESGRSIVLRHDPNSEPVMLYAVTCAKGDFRKLRTRIENEIVPVLERCEGVSSVSVSGGHSRQINVDLDGGKLYSRNISIGDVVRGIEASNCSFPAGTMVRGNREFTVRTMGEFSGTGDILITPVGRNQTGVPVYLKDIGTVQDGYADRKCMVMLNGQEAVGLSIYREQGKNCINTCRAIEALMGRLEKEYRNEFRFNKITDQSGLIRSAIRGVFDAAIVGGIIAVLVIWFFMKDVGFSLILAVSIPVSILFTYSLMYFFNITLNVISLGGLAIGIGMMVDSGIVVLDSIREKLDECGNDRGNATLAIIEGVEQVKNPVIVSVAASLVVFLPVLFLSGIPGAVFGDMALTISFSNIGTLIASLALIPLLSELRIKGILPRFLYSSERLKFTDAFYAISDSFFEWLSGQYIHALSLALSNRRITIIASLVLVLLGILFSFSLERELMPGVDSDRFTIAITTPPGTPLDDSASFARLIESRIQGNSEIRSLFTKVGSEPKEAIYDRLSGMQANQANITVLLGDSRRSSARDIISGIKKNLSVPDGVEIDFSVKKEIISALLSGQQKPFVIELYGKDLSILKSRGDDLKRRLVSVKGLGRVSSTLDAATPECRIDMDRTAMASLNIAAASASSALHAAIRGDVACAYHEGDNDIDVRVRLKETDRSGFDTIGNIAVKTNGGDVVSAGKFLTVRTDTGADKIIRSDRSRVNILSADIIGSHAEVFSRARKLLCPAVAGRECEARLLGEYDEIRKSAPDLIFVTLLSVLLIYMVLSSQFQSFSSPLIVMLSIPLMLPGVSGALLLTGMTLNINSVLGIVLLAGTVVNNSIVLFDFIKIESGRGLDLRTAILEAGRKRLKAILMTTATTVFGMLPVAIGIGEGSEIQRSLAVATIGGLTVSTMLTLIIMPSIYYSVYRHYEKNESPAGTRR